VTGRIGAGSRGAADDRIAHAGAGFAPLVDRTGIHVDTIGVGGAAAGEAQVRALTENRVAAVSGARVPVVAVDGCSGRTATRLAGLGAVAEVAVAAGCAVRSRGMLAAAGAARVDGAGVAIVALSRRRACRAAEDCAVGATGARAAAVGGAGVPVVAVERGAGGAGPALTGLGAVAGIAVAAGGAVRHGGRRAMPGAAHVGGAGIPVVALAVRRAGGAAGDGRMNAAGSR